MTYEFYTEDLALALERVDNDPRWPAADYRERAEILRDTLKEIVQ